MSIDDNLKDISGHILEKSYDDIIDLLSYWLQLHLKEHYIKEKKHIYDLTEVIINLIEKIIERTFEDFGHYPKIAKHCINHYFNIGDKFSLSDLCEIIQTLIFTCNFEKVRKFLTNETRIDKKDPKIKKIEKKKYQIIEIFD